jgi:hypothetical protein
VQLRGRSGKAAAPRNRFKNAQCIEREWLRHVDQIF